MFERYTEKAQRVIFFARYEASQFGSPYIETEHLLLGLLHEDKALTFRFLRSHASVESIRKQIEGHITIREKLSTSVDLPLSNEYKRVLAYAAEEAERLSHKHVGTEHLLLGLLREEKGFTAVVNPASPCFRIAMICSSLCRVPFMAVLLSWVWENSHSRRSSFRGLRQYQSHHDFCSGFLFSRVFLILALKSEITESIYKSR